MLKNVCYSRATHQRFTLESWSAAASNADNVDDYDYGPSQFDFTARTETINGRVAQLAFVAGVGAELATGETLPAQFHDHVFSLAFVSTLVALASFMPDAQAKKYTAEPSTKGAFGPFSPGKEMLHGRLAMIGLAAAFAMELHSGTPLFVR